MVDDFRGAKPVYSMTSISTLSRAIEYMQGTRGQVKESDLPIMVEEHSANGRLVIRVFNNQKKLIAYRG